MLREALGQLKGLRRRKLALKMLGEAVQSGLNKKDSVALNETKEGEPTVTRKRKVNDDNEDGNENNGDESTNKKRRT